MIPFRYNLRSLIVRKGSSLFTLFGVGLVVFVLAASMMLSAGIKKTLATGGREDVAIVLRKGSDAELGSVIENQQVSLIAAQPGVKSIDGKPAAVGETVVVVALPKRGTEGMTNVQIRGVVPEALAVRPKIELIQGRHPRPGSDEVEIGQRLLGRFEGMELGKSFEIRKNRSFTVVGVFSAQGSSYESEAWVDQDTLRSAFGRQGMVSSVRVLLESKRQLETLRANLERDPRLGLQVLGERSYFEKLSEGTSMFVVALGTVVSIFFSLGAMIGAMITMYGSVAYRQREIGTLRALGFGRLQVMLSFLFESIVLALAGGVLGSAVALALGQIKISMMNFQSWSEVVFQFDPNPTSLGVALIFALGMGLLGGFFPALRAARISPVEAMRA